jgi:type II secretory pathway pseudopilin PulG
MGRIFKNKAFTLIEITFVAVILGLAAMMMFPSVYGQIEKNKGQEARQTMDVIMTAMETCVAKWNVRSFLYTYSYCQDFETIGLPYSTESPGNDRDPFSGVTQVMVTANFKYEFTDRGNCINPPAVPISCYGILATRTTDPNNKIKLRKMSDGSIECVGEGDFVNAC